MTEGRVYALCRVSSQSSANSDISIPAQRSIIRDYKATNCKNMKWGDACYPEDETPGFFVDRAVSAWSKKFSERPASSRLLAVLKEGDVLLMHSVSRGFRNIVDFCQTMSALTARGVKVRFITEDGINLETASGKLLGNILAAISQYSSDIKSERIREAHAIKRLGLTEKKFRVSKTKWEPSEYVDFFSQKEKKPEVTGGTVYGYIRCSHETSLESELGLKAQASGVSSYIEKLCKSDKNLKAGVTFRDEAVSAFSVHFKERPEGSKLMKLLKPGDHLVVYRLDRAWRSIQDAARMVDELTKNGIHVHLVMDGVSTTDEFGKLMFNTLAYVAWMESHLMSKKSLEVAQYLRKCGRPTNKDAPAGLKKRIIKGKKKLTLDMDAIAEHRMVYELFELLGLGADSLRDVLIAWHSVKGGIPIKKAKLKVPNAGTLNMYRKRYRKFQEYLSSRGIRMPRKNGPHDHPAFGEILRKSLPYRDIQKLKGNKNLEAVLLS